MAVRDDYFYFLNYFKNDTNENDIACTYLLPNEDIEENNWYFMDYLNISEVEKQKNLSEDVINSGADMFHYLNSCPKTETKKDIKTFFERVFKKYLFEPTNSGIILYTLNAKRLFPNDKRIIASKILEKVLKVLDLSLVPFQNFLKNSNEDSSIGKFL